MSSPPYEACEEGIKRTRTQNTASVFRDEQRFIELDSSKDLCLQSVMRMLPPLNKTSKDWPTIVVLGDGASLDDDAFAKQKLYFQNGVLRAAYGLEAHIVDNGLGSSVAVGSTNSPDVTDFARSILHIGIMPCCDEAPSRYTTHQIVLADFDGWEDRPDIFVKRKFEFVRRLNGKSCRSVCVLFNSGPSAFEEVSEACRLGLPVIIMKGSGKLADDLASALENGSGGNNESFKKLVDSRCLYVFDANSGRECDLAGLIKCHCLADMVTMTRMLSDLEPIDSVTYEGTPYFCKGKPESQVRMRVGVDGKLKYVGKTQNGFKKNRRYRIISMRNTSQVPTPPKGKRGIFRSGNATEQVPAGKLPPIPAEVKQSSDAEDDLLFGNISSKSEATPEIEDDEINNGGDLPNSNDVEDEDEEARQRAAIKIQAAERRREAQKQVAKMREEQKSAENADTDDKKEGDKEETEDDEAKQRAAIRIQAAERRREAQKQVAKMREEQKSAENADTDDKKEGDKEETEDDEAKQRAAIRIQAAERRREAQKKVAQMREEQKSAENADTDDKKEGD